MIHGLSIAATPASNPSHRAIPTSNPIHQPPSHQANPNHRPPYHATFAFTENGVSDISGATT
jgi:hypothetical protein